MARILSNPIYVWLAIAVLLFVIESVTVNLITIWFAIGSLCAMATAIAGGNGSLQIGVFAVVSAILLILTRPFVVKFASKHPTNADMIIGQEAIVVECIQNVEGKGQIVIQGNTWSARSENQMPIEEGAIVIIKEIVGVKAIVTKKE